MVTIFVDEKQYTVAEGKNLLEACLQQGLDLPYFCWHPAMGSVGSCRQCAVRQYSDANDTRGRIVMSCMTPVSEGLRVSISEALVSEFRDTSIEVLMANHPHDCPVCEEGGECHLQDMTLLSGHTERRYQGKKKTFTNQDLGPCINHEMNRCITCYRCVRFYNDYAGDTDLAAMSSRDQVYFGRQEPGTLTSHFSGNLVEVCPTGVFTDKTLARSYSRKWDLQSAPSICTGCSLGCNISPGERHGTIKRITNRYHGEINGYFICDRGRFGYDHSNRSERYRHCLSRPGPGDSAELQISNYEECLVRVQQRLQRSDGSDLIGIGSPRATVEENFALQTLVGADNFYSPLNASEQQVMLTIVAILGQADITNPSLKDIEQADAVLILGEDLLHSAPMMALSVRQATRNRSYDMAKANRIPLWQDASVRNLAQAERSPLMVLNSHDSELDELASLTYYQAPDRLAQLVLAAAHQLDNALPAVPGLPDALQARAGQIADCLRQAKNPVILAGSSLNSVELVSAAGILASALAHDGQPAQLTFVLAEANSLGLALLTCDRPGQHLNSAISRAKATANSVAAILLNTNLYQHERAAKVDAFLTGLKQRIVLEQQPNPSAAQASILIPSTSVFETEGSLVNNEGRAQRFFAVSALPQGDIQDTWRTLVRFASRPDSDSLDPEQVLRSRLADCTRFDQLVDLLAERGGVFADWAALAPSADFRIAGMKVPRQTHRASGRTSVAAQVSVVERKQPVDLDSALAFTMEGAQHQVPSALATNSWAPGWNSNESIHKFQAEINGALQGGDPGVRLTLPAYQYQDDANRIPSVGSPGQIWAVKRSHFFAGEEYSSYSPALLERASPARVQMHPDLAASLGLAPGDIARVTLAGQSALLTVACNAKLATTVITLPADQQTLAQLPLALLPGTAALILHQAYSPELKLTDLGSADE